MVSTRLVPTMCSASDGSCSAEMRQAGQVCSSGLNFANFDDLGAQRPGSLDGLRDGGDAGRGWCCWNTYPPLTVAALAPPTFSTRRVTAPFRWPCTFVRRSRFCWVIGSLVLSSSGLPLARTPSRRSWVRPTDFVTILSPIQLHLQRVLGFTTAGWLTRCSCLTALHFRLNGHAPMTSTRPALAVPAAFGIPLRRLQCSGARPLPRRCWVPHVRAPGLDFHLLSVDHASRTRVLRPAGWTSYTPVEVAAADHPVGSCLPSPRSDEVHDGDPAATFWLR
jgi:hypothetical protein